MNWYPIILVLAAMLSPLCVVTVYALWIERYKPYIETVRNFLLLSVALQTLVEGGLVWMGSLRSWFFVPMILINCWGFLDAVLRFPVVHDIESAFTLKNILLLAFKMATILFSSMSLDNPVNMARMVALLMTNLIVCPCLYLIGLPLGADQQNQREAAHDVNDVDMAQSAYRLITSSEQRRESLFGLKKRVQHSGRKILTLPMAATLADALEVSLSPSHRKAMSPNSKKV